MATELMYPGESRRARLFADPLLTGDLLLIALAWDALLTSAPVPTTAAVAAMTGLDINRCWAVMRTDIPTYQAPKQPRICQHTGPRGGSCRLVVTHQRALSDRHTGEISWAASCSLLTHRAWADNIADQHLRDYPGPYPLPVYNRRSRVAHHFPEIDFPEWWTRLTRGRWESPYDPARDPERGGSVTLPRPALRLVHM